MRAAVSAESANASVAERDDAETETLTPSGESPREAPASGASPLARAEREAAGPPFALVLGLFLFSGATGLVDQLCFSKYLSYVVGSTAHAVSAVLAAFMTGLALGAHLGGKISSRVERPLFGYGLLELVVAASVALSPLAFGALTPLYVALARAAPSSIATISAVRWLLAMLLVVVPTAAMGATLPLLSRAIGGRSHDGEADGVSESRLGALYATNTLGGAVGALLAAYAVLPALGIRSTLFASASLSALVGALAVTFGRHARVLERIDSEVATSSALSAPTSARRVRPRAELATAELVVLTPLAFASGFLVFACEVVFTHLLALVIGNSAYAFGLILAIFLLCLFFGASRAAAWQRRFGDAALPLGLGGSALALALTLPVWDRLPSLFAGTGWLFTTFAARETVRAVAAFVVLVVPTTLMGLTFPLLLQRVAATVQVGRLVGRLTAINTIGAVTGSLATGYFVLPALGSQRSIVAIAAAFAVAAIAAPARAATLRLLGPLLGAAGVLVAFLIPRWDLARLTCGLNVYFDTKETTEQILYLHEDIHGGVTSVTVKPDGVHTLYTNGKFQGNDGWELNAQRYFAHYSTPFVSNVDSALVIGLGTGTTLGTLLTYPWKRVDVAEISPSIVEAAGRFFKHTNRGALSDPRVVLHHADGRNFLLVSDARYDLISMELSSVWFAGAANLYSREFYALARAHLKPQGVLQQWVQLHHIRSRDFASILHTLKLEFGHAALLYGGGQGILIASSQPLRISSAHLNELASVPQIRETVPDGRSLLDLPKDVLVTDSGLEDYVEEVARAEGLGSGELLSSDDNLHLEYGTPRGNVLPWASREELVKRLLRHREESAIAAMWVQ